VPVNKKRQALLRAEELIPHCGKAYFLWYIKINEVPLSKKY